MRLFAGLQWQSNGTGNFGKRGSRGRCDPLNPTDGDDAGATTGRVLPASR